MTPAENRCWRRGSEAGRRGRLSPQSLVRRGEQLEGRQAPLREGCAELEVTAAVRSDRQQPDPSSDAAAAAALAARSALPRTRQEWKEVPWVKTSLLEVTEESAPKGAVIEFVYPRGARAGEKRTLEIEKWYQSSSNVTMVSGKDLSVGGASKNYVASITQSS